MNPVGTGHIRRLKDRISFLEERIRTSEKPLSYDTSELKALRWAVRQIENEENGIRIDRAYKNGQRNILEFYQKTLKKAVHSGNVAALQFLLDRTNEWQEKLEK